LIYHLVSDWHTPFSPAVHIAIQPSGKFLVNESNCSSLPYTQRNKITNPQSFRFSLDPNQTLLGSCRGNVVGTEHAMGCPTEESRFSSRLRKSNFPQSEPHGSRSTQSPIQKVSADLSPGIKRDTTTYHYLQQKLKTEWIFISTRPYDK